MLGSCSLLHQRGSRQTEAGVIARAKFRAVRNWFVTAELRKTCSVSSMPSQAALPRTDRSGTRINSIGRKITGNRRGCFPFQLVGLVFLRSELFRRRLAFRSGLFLGRMSLTAPSSDFEGRPCRDDEPFAFVPSIELTNQHAALSRR